MANHTPERGDAMGATADQGTPHQLAADAVADPMGGVNAATYDTAQLILSAASRPDRIDGQLLRAGIDRLLTTQNTDGSWGHPRWPHRYRLLPTLSAATALAHAPGSTQAPALAQALDHLTSQPQLSTPARQPDLMAVELVMPALLEQLTEALSDNGDTPAANGAGHLATDARQSLGHRFSQALTAWGSHRERIARLRRSVSVGEAVPVQLAYSAELMSGCQSSIDALATPLPIGCSAAATAAFAAWSASPQPAAARMITQQARRLNGGLPDIMAMTTFEAQWILSLAVRSRIPLAAPERRHWQQWLARQVEPGGVRGGPGLPPDGDDTAVTLYTLQQLGQHIEPACLLKFIDHDGCASYPGERTRSTTTTAHALEALSGWLEAHPESQPEFGPAREALLNNLLHTQTQEGSWSDKWHASPHYATYCAVAALTRFGGPEARSAIRRVTRWLLSVQRPDGSWGQWTATLEETALALLTIHHSLLDVQDQPRQALRRGTAFLRTNHHAPADSDMRTPLWQGKELYEPHRIVEATIFTALFTTSPPSIAPAWGCKNCGSVP